MQLCVRSQWSEVCECVSNLNDVTVFFFFLRVFSCVVKSTLINSQLESVLVNHLSLLSFHSQMHTSVAVLELSLCATRGHDRYDISFDLAFCLSNVLAVWL